MTNSSTATDALADANVRAFLDAIAWAEGTDRAADPYRVTFGYAHTISDLSDHPAVTGEWSGRTFTDAKGRRLLSTAAGRYQFLRGTWLECKRALRLPDFGQASQDAACVYLIKRRGALDAVKAGRIAEAAELCRREWASLPGAGYAQPERTLAALLDRYADQGGTLA
ncbi:MAG: glycoside hydrolase family 104 protein [Burkholderiaceae bacterium]|nr:glycoside hydrolase family 104 protein [Burkholderiaceae bacterium]